MDREQVNNNVQYTLLSLRILFPLADLHGSSSLPQLIFDHFLPCLEADHWDYPRIRIAYK